MAAFEHPFDFDPSYGYSLNDLLAISAPKAPIDFASYWQARYRRSVALCPQFQLTPLEQRGDDRLYELCYQSTAGFTIKGWLLEPKDDPVSQVIVVGHGYGGREQADDELRLPRTALIFPCFRGLGASRCASVPEQPERHVLHGVDSRDEYIIGGCVEDLWLAVSVALAIYPQAAGNIAYMGISFGGGIGALAVPWDDRIRRAHFNVPTFGNQVLRLQLPSWGSAAALQDYAKQRPHVPDVLAYYDAAIAAAYAEQTAHFALAGFDPMVVAPGQFSIYNNWAAEKSLFVLEAGHFDHPRLAEEQQRLLLELKAFFSP